MLYPLFVHNIGALLYHPTNQTRTNTIMAAAERRKQEQNQMRNVEASGLLSPSQLHQYSMNIAPSPLEPALTYPGTGCPGLDQAHTFPTLRLAHRIYLVLVTWRRQLQMLLLLIRARHFLEHHHCHGRTMRSIKAAILHFHDYSHHQAICTTYLVVTVPLQIVVQMVLETAGDKR